MDQGRVPESLLEEHNNRHVVDLRDDVSLVSESLDELSEGLSDEGIPTSLPSSVDDIVGRVDVQHKPDDLHTGPITRACAKLLEQQVNSLLTEYNLFTNENFILPKSLHVCMTRFVAEASMTHGGEELHEDIRRMVPIISESMREERKAGAPPLKKKS
jgi:hypothetical protein